MKPLNPMWAAALEPERQTGELSRLVDLGVELSWLDEENARTSPVPLVTTGVNMLTGQNHWRSITHARMQAGLGTLVIPGFKPGDYASVTGAPTALEAVPAQAQIIHWEALQLRVPASVAFRTKLHASKWAVLEGIGALLLSYRPTNARGCVVFCGASVASRRPGADSGDQARLLQTLLDLTAATRADANSNGSLPASLAATGPSLTAAEFLSAFPEIAPHALLLLLGGWDPQQPNTSPEFGRSLFGFEPDADFQAAAARVQGTPDEIESALRRAGWGPFIRKLQERLHELREETHV